MTLREVTRAVISLVEKESGCQVIVSEDTSIRGVGLRVRLSNHDSLVSALLNVIDFAFSSIHPITNTNHAGIVFVITTGEISHE